LLQPAVADYDRPAPTDSLISVQFLQVLTYLLTSRTTKVTTVHSHNILPMSLSRYS